MAIVEALLTVFEEALTLIEPIFTAFEEALTVIESFLTFSLRICTPL